MLTAQFTLTRECNASVIQSSWAQAVRQLGVPGPLCPLSGVGSSVERRVGHSQKASHAHSQVWCYCCLGYQLTKPCGALSAILVPVQVMRVG